MTEKINKVKIERSVTKNVISGVAWGISGILALSAWLVPSTTTFAIFVMLSAIYFAIIAK